MEKPKAAAKKAANKPAAAPAEKRGSVADHVRRSGRNLDEKVTFRDLIAMENEGILGSRTKSDLLSSETGGSTSWSRERGELTKEAQPS